MIRVLLVLLGMLSFAPFYAAAQSVTPPSPLAPMGVISPERQLTFEWNAVPGAAWYDLWVSLPSGGSLERWYDGANVCQFKICAVTPGMALEAGVYRWWLQAWSPEGGYSAWSGETRFTVMTFPATPFAPTGTISETQPTLQWYASPNASWYYVWLSDANGHVLDQWFPASQCAAGVCAVAPLTLPPGSYRWWVQAWQQDGGYGAWSSETAFSIAG